MTEAKEFKMSIEPMSAPNREGLKLPNPKLLHAMLGSVNHLYNLTSPDLCFAANQISQFN